MYDHELVINSIVGIFFADILFAFVGNLWQYASASVYLPTGSDKIVHICLYSIVLILYPIESKIVHLHK